jgi:cysteine desulfurase
MKLVRSPTENSSIYLDFQASTPVDTSVADGMCDWIRHHCGNPHSDEHAFGWSARDAVERARSAIANLVDAHPEDIVFTSGATEANNLAILGAAERASAGRDTILVSAIEHASVLEPARLLSRRGFKVVVLPVDSEGRLQAPAFEQALNDRVLLVSVAAVNNEVGTLQDIHTIGARCRSVGALFHTDAAQALTGCALPLGAMPVDLASLSSHKAYGPAGIGALYVGPNVIDRIAPQILGGAQQSGLRSGTLPTALCIGFGRACEILSATGEAERNRVASLRDRFWRVLSNAIPDAVLNGPNLSTPRHPGNLNVAFLNVDARDLIQRVQPQLACSTGSACHSGTEEPSHVLAALGLDEKRARSSLRLSIGRQTTDDEVVRATQVLLAAVLAESNRLMPALDHG